MTSPEDLGEAPAPPLRRGRRRALVALLVIAALLGAAWQAVPGIAAMVLRERLAAAGLPQPRLSVDSIGWHRAVITDLHIGDADEIAIDRLVIEYDPVNLLDFRGATVLKGPELGVFEEGVPGGEAADDEAGAAVEESAAEEKELQEAERGVGEHAQPGGVLAGVQGVEGGPVGVAVLLGDEAIEVESGVMLQRVDQLADFAAGDDDVGVDTAGFVA